MLRNPLLNTLLQARNEGQRVVSIHQTTTSFLLCLQSMSYNHEYTYVYNYRIAMENPAYAILEDLCCICGNSLQKRSLAVSKKTKAMLQHKIATTGVRHLVRTSRELYSRDVAHCWFINLDSEYSLAKISSV